MRQKTLMEIQQERDMLLERYLEARKEEKLRIIARIAVLDEEAEELKKKEAV